MCGTYWYNGRRFYKLNQDYQYYLKWILFQWSQCVPIASCSRRRNSFSLVLFYRKSIPGETNKHCLILTILKNFKSTKKNAQLDYFGEYTFMNSLHAMFSFVWDTMTMGHIYLDLKGLSGFESCVYFINDPDWSKCLCWVTNGANLNQIIWPKYMFIFIFPATFVVNENPNNVYE